MAFVSQGYRASLTLIDNGRKIINRSYELRSSTVDHPAAVTATIALEVALAAASDLECIAYSVAEIFQEGAVSYPVALNAQAEMQALVNVGLESTPLKTATLAIPGPIDAMFKGAPSFTGYDDVDGANAVLIAFMDLFKETGGTFSLSDGEQIADAGSFKTGRRTHRKSRRG